MTEGVEARLRELEERVSLLQAKSDIHDGLMRYCRGCDRRDADLISSVFWPDAVNELQEVVGSFATDPSLAREYSDEMDKSDPEFAGVRWHFIGNELIEVEGDIAFSEAYFRGNTYMETDGKRYLRTRCLRYLDRWERRGGEWKIAHHALVDDWNNLEEIEGNGVARWAAIVGKSHLPMYQVRLYGSQTRDDPSYRFKQLKPGERLLPPFAGAAEARS
jgi:ketosteroid isomerase-like protein